MNASDTSRFTTAVRTWLDACNQVRETKDPIDIQRTQRAMGDVAKMVKLLKSGHLRCRPEAAPMVIVLDVMLAQGTFVGPLFAASRPLAHALVKHLREYEEVVRTELATITGKEVPPRSTAHDAIEDAQFSVPAPPRPLTPKLVLS